MWGQGNRVFMLSTKNRIIPTRVGTRLILLVRYFHNKDHPHACGDKTPIYLPVHFLLGSSPRVWGQADISKGCYTVVGIIPTRVGTRQVSLFRQSVKQDHPHACGDKCGYLIPINSAEGSSPRVWGQAHIRYHI